MKKIEVKQPISIASVFMKFLLSTLLCISSLCSSSCGQQALLIADFEQDQIDGLPNYNFPGDPEGDLLEVNNAQLNVIYSGIFNSKALEFTKPATREVRYIDFIASGQNYNSGLISVEFLFTRDALGTNTPTASFTLLTEDDKPLATLNNDHLEGAEYRGIPAGSLLTVQHGTPDGKTTTTTLGGYVPGEALRCKFELNMDASTFSLTIEGNSFEGTEYFDNSLINKFFILKRTNLNFKKMRVWPDPQKLE